MSSSLSLSRSVVFYSSWDLYVPLNSVSHWTSQICHNDTEISIILYCTRRKLLMHSVFNKRSFSRTIITHIGTRGQFFRIPYCTPYTRTVLLYNRLVHYSEHKISMYGTVGVHTVGSVERTYYCIPVCYCTRTLIFCIQCSQHWHLCSVLINSWDAALHSPPLREAKIFELVADCAPVWCTTTSYWWFEDKNRTCTVV